MIEVPASNFQLLQIAPRWVAEILSDTKDGIRERCEEATSSQVIQAQRSVIRALWSMRQNEDGSFSLPAEPMELLHKDGSGARLLLVVPEPCNVVDNHPLGSVAENLRTDCIED